MEDSLYDPAFEPDVDVQEEEHVEEEVEQEEPLSEDEQQILYNGYLVDDFKIGHHRIVIRTLKMGEELEASLAAQRFFDTNDHGRALMAAFVAASIVSFDGKPLNPEPIMPADETIDAKVQYLLSEWYWPQTAFVYRKYDNLVKRSIDLFDAIKKD